MKKFIFTLIACICGFGLPLVLSMINPGHDMAFGFLGGVVYMGVADFLNKNLNIA